MRASGIPLRGMRLKRDGALAGSTVRPGYDHALNDLDDCLWQIKEASDILLDTAIGADIPVELFGRLSFGAKTITLYAIKAEVLSDEAFAFAKNAAPDITVTAGAAVVAPGTPGSIVAV